MAQFPLSELLREAQDGTRALAVQHSGFAGVYTLHHTAAAAPGNGTDTDIAGLRTAGVQIAGTATTGAVTFLGSIDGTNFVPVAGTRYSADSLQSTGAIGEAWRIDVSGLTKLRVRIDSLSGGTMTVTSRVVA